MVLIVIEVMVNGTFLAKGSELGLLGGAVEASIFAALNVLISFFIAFYGVRQLNHRRTLLKLIGIISIILYILFSLSLNLALAHYREVSGTLIDEAGREVIRRLTALDD